MSNASQEQSDLADKLGLKGSGAWASEMTFSGGVMPVRSNRRKMREAEHKNKSEIVSNVDGSRCLGNMATAGVRYHSSFRAAK